MLLVRGKKKNLDILKYVPKNFPQNLTIIFLLQVLSKMFWKIADMHNSIATAITQSQMGSACSGLLKLLTHKEREGDYDKSLSTPLMDKWPVSRGSGISETAASKCQGM